MTDPLDKGADRDNRIARPCSKRLPNMGWCIRPDAHPGECAGPPRTLEPVPPETLFVKTRRR